MLGRKIQTLLEMSREAKLPLLVATLILVFLSIFTKNQASSPFEALIELSAHLEVSNGYEALGPEEVENYGFL